jgi:arsenate reductase
MKLRVLFLCATNGIQSPMAEALLKKIDSENFEVASAGIECESLNPVVRKVMSDIGIELEYRYPVAVTDVAQSDFDFVITLSPLAKMRCPAFPNAELVHWQIDDPAPAADDGGQSADGNKQIKVFEAIRDQIALRIRLFALVQARSRTVAVVTPSSKPPDRSAFDAERRAGVARSRAT